MCAENHIPTFLFACFNAISFRFPTLIPVFFCEFGMILRTEEENNSVALLAVIQAALTCGMILPSSRLAQIK